MWLRATSPRASGAIRDGMLPSGTLSAASGLRDADHDGAHPSRFGARHRVGNIMESHVPCVVYAAKSTEDVRGSIETQIGDCPGSNRAAGRPPCRLGTYRRGRFSLPWQPRSRPRGCQTGCRAPRCPARWFELWVQHSDRLARGDGLAADHLAEVFFEMRRAGVSFALYRTTTFTNPMFAPRSANVTVKTRPVRAPPQGRENGGGGRRGRRSAVPVHDGYMLMPELDERATRYRARRPCRLIGG